MPDIKATLAELDGLVNGIEAAQSVNKWAVAIAEYRLKTAAASAYPAIRAHIATLEAQLTTASGNARLNADEAKSHYDDLMAARAERDRAEADNARLRAVLEVAMVLIGRAQSTAASLQLYQSIRAALTTPPSDWLIAHDAAVREPLEREVAELRQKLGAAQQAAIDLAKKVGVERVLEQVTAERNEAERTVLALREALESINTKLCELAPGRIALALAEAFTVLNSAIDSPAEAARKAEARIEARVLGEAYRNICAAMVRSEDKGIKVTWSDAACMVNDMAEQAEKGGE